MSTTIHATGAMSTATNVIAPSTIRCGSARNRRKKTAARRRARSSVTCSHIEAGVLLRGRPLGPPELAAGVAPVEDPAVPVGRFHLQAQPPAGAIGEELTM